MMTSSPGFKVACKALVITCLPPAQTKTSSAEKSRWLSRLNLAAMAARSSGMPGTGGYFVSPRSIASWAALRTCCGVSKSGSPILSETISRPSARNMRPSWVISMVGDASICSSKSDLLNSAKDYTASIGLSRRPGTPPSQTMRPPYRRRCISRMVQGGTAGTMPVEIISPASRGNQMKTRRPKPGCACQASRFDHEHALPSIPDGQYSKYCM